MQVSNAQEELLLWYAENAKNNPKIFHAAERCAGGIIQAIGHFGLGPNTSPRDVTETADSHLEDAGPAHEVVKFNLFYEKWRRAEVEQCEMYIASLKASCVCLISPTPNYCAHSIWILSSCHLRLKKRESNNTRAFRGNIYCCFKLKCDWTILYDRVSRLWSSPIHVSALV